MTEQLTATIIPFPTRARPAPAASVLTPPAREVAAGPARQPPKPLAQSSQRLTQALADLSLALADQKDATLRWKAAIEDLATKMRTLSEVRVGQQKIS